MLAAAIGLGAWLNVADCLAAPDMAALKLCYDDVDVRPWRYRHGGGLDFQLLERAGKRAGISFEYEAQPLHVCLTKLSAGQVDGILGGSSISGASADSPKAGRFKAGASMLLHMDGESASYLVLSSALAVRIPELPARLRQSVEAVRASAAYRTLERQTLAMLGRT